MNARRTDRYIFWSFVLLYSCFVFQFRTGFHTYDSIDYVAMARSGTWVRQFHPHHLLYHLLLYFMGKISFSNPGAIRVVFTPFAIPTSLGAGLTIGMIYLVMRRFTSIFSACMAAIGTGLSFSMLFMSTDIEKYPLATFFSLTALYYAIYRKSLKKHHIFLSGFFLSAGVMMHQLTALLFPLFLIFTASRMKQKTLRKMCITIFTATFIVFTILPYISVHAIVSPDADSSLFRWSTRYVQTGKWGHGLEVAPMFWLKGYFNSFFHVSLPKWSIDFGAGHLFPAAVLASLILLSLITVHRISDRDMRSFMLLSFTWMLVFPLFIIWWEPLNVKIATLSMPAAWMTFTLCCSHIRDRLYRHVVTVLVLTVISMEAWFNLPFIFKRHVEHSNPDILAAEAIASITAPDTYILVPFNGTIDLYLTKFLDRPHCITLRSVFFSRTDAGSFRKYLKQSLSVFCQKHMELYLTRFACEPFYEPPAGLLTTDDIKNIMRPLLERSVFVTKLATGDNLMRLTPKEMCTLSGIIDASGR